MLAGDGRRSWVLGQQLADCTHLPPAPTTLSLPHSLSQHHTNRAFEKLADKGQGLAAIQFRRVPCTYQPPAPAPAGPTGMPSHEQPAALGFRGSADFSPSDVFSQKLVRRFDDAGEAQGELRA